MSANEGPAGQQFVRLVPELEELVDGRRRELLASQVARSWLYDLVRKGKGATREQLGQMLREVRAMTHPNEAKAADKRRAKRRINSFTVKFDKPTRSRK